jgi:aspartyl protease family protein
MAIGFTDERFKWAKVRKARHAKGVFLAALMACPPALATDVTVVGLTAGKAIVVVDGGKPKTLAVGQIGPGGVKLVSATSESAVLEIDGKQRTLGMGQAISGSFQPADKPRVSLTADATGHYMTAGSIDGAPVRFLVDTGATLVSIGASDARRLGLRYLTGEKGYSHTANGVTTVYRIKLDSVKVGNIAMTNVDAVVHPDNDMPFVLLGMSFLGRLELRHEGRTLTMTQRF